MAEKLGVGVEEHNFRNAGIRVKKRRLRRARQAAGHHRQAQVAEQEDPDPGRCAVEAPAR
ncbi:MAG: hypothetical protein MZV70_67910 [Desulfobacterales bacterium]|nr:hypothetical protein [Desulfobacterales bacterium]